MPAASYLGIRRIIIKNEAEESVPIFADGEVRFVNDLAQHLHQGGRVGRAASIHGAIVEDIVFTTISSSSDAIGDISITRVTSIPRAKFFSVQGDSVSHAVAHAISVCALLGSQLGNVVQLKPERLDTKIDKLGTEI